MIRHILKIVWNRKGSNGLIAFEILVAFLVTFSVTAMAVHNYDRYRRPLGFAWDDVWSLEFATGGTETAPLSDIIDVIERLIAEIGTLDRVEGVGAVSFPLYSGSGWGSTLDRPDGGKVSIRLMNASDEFAEVAGVELLNGRWFGPEDDADSRIAAVINRSLAETYFDGDPLGRVIEDNDDEAGMRLVVVGVIEDFRYRGELSKPAHFAFLRPSVVDDYPYDFIESFVVRVSPGTSAAYEESILKLAEAVAPEWSFRIKPVALKRAEYLRERLAPLVVAGLVSGFLMVMVALGLVGVLWQNVTHRTRELGLRRVKGATAVRIRRQVLAELLVMTTLAIAVGTLMIVQVPIIGWFPTMTAPVYAAALAISAAVMALLTTVAGLYPSYLATRIEPAEALHYE